MARKLRIPSRYYRSLPIDDASYETEMLELDADRTAFVGMHCWNIGMPDGPEIDVNYCVGMGFPQALAEAARIVNEMIRPAMDAARAANVLVAHVESATIAAKHPEAQQYLDPPPLPSAMPPRAEVVPGYRASIVARSHGLNYATQSPYARMDRAEAVMPLPGELFVYETTQFDRALRFHGIENLIYSGFATDMCILRAPGGVEPMAPYGYRIFLMRDATIGVELPDTFEERIATRWGIAYFEAHYGNTITREDFIKACEEIR